MTVLRATQWMQRVMQPQVISRVLDDRDGLSVPWTLCLFQRCPRLRRLSARLVGIGVRPEHVRTPAVPRRIPPS